MKVNHTEMLKEIYKIFIDDNLTIDEVYDLIITLYNTKLKDVIDEVQRERDKDALKLQIDKLQDELKILQELYNAR